MTRAKRKVVITGTGRCGTQYIASVLAVCGVKAGHQKLDYNSGDILRSMKELDIDVDVSYQAASFLDSIKDEGILMVGLFRSPEKVIRSILELGQFRDFTGEACSYDKIEALCHYYTRISAALLTYATYIFDIENIDLKELFKVIGWGNLYNDTLVNGIPDNSNARVHDKGRTLELLPSDLPHHVIEAYGKLNNFKNIY